MSPLRRSLPLALAVLVLASAALASAAVGLHRPAPPPVPEPRPLPRRLAEPDAAEPDAAEPDAAEPGAAAPARAAAPAAAPRAPASRPLRYGPLVFGASDRAALERFFGAPVACTPIQAPWALPRRVEACGPAAPRAAASSQLPDDPAAPLPVGPSPLRDAVLADGTLRSLRFLLPESATAVRAVPVLTALCGGAPRLGAGRGGARDLRLWIYPGFGPGTAVRCLLAEVRDRRTGAVRLSVAMADLRDGWLPSRPAAP